jgi:hypothetical protein
MGRIAGRHATLLLLSQMKSGMLILGTQWRA